MSIASSSDGNKLAAVVAGGVYTSSDSGVTWVDQSLVPGSVISGDLAWMSIASSSDDTKLAAVVFGGSLYTSNDSGVTWVDQSLVPGSVIPAGSVFWSDITSSSDGTKLAAADINGHMYASNDSGVTWVTSTVAFQLFPSIASSTNGTKLAVTGSRCNTLWTSTDSGVTWEQRFMVAIPKSSQSPFYPFHPVFDNETPYGCWSSIASSSDGTKLAAVFFSGSNTIIPSLQLTGGHLLTSTDSGLTWVDQPAISGSAISGLRNWQSVAISSDSRQ